MLLRRLRRLINSWLDKSDSHFLPFECQWHKFSTLLNFLLLITCSRYTVQQTTICGSTLCRQALGKMGQTRIVDQCSVQFRQLRIQKEHATVHLESEDYGGTKFMACNVFTVQSHVPFVWALVNIPAVSEVHKVWLPNEWNRSKFSKYRFVALIDMLQFNYQFCSWVLDDATKCNPGAWWWLKADECDKQRHCYKGLKTSTKL